MEIARVTEDVAAWRVPHKHDAEVARMAQEDLHAVREVIRRSAKRRKGVTPWALSVEVWHALR